MRSHTGPESQRTLEVPPLAQAKLLALAAWHGIDPQALLNIAVDEFIERAIRKTGQGIPE